MFINDIQSKLKDTDLLMCIAIPIVKTPEKKPVMPEVLQEI